MGLRLDLSTLSKARLWKAAVMTVRVWRDKDTGA
jgi:hypothetical protein